MRRYLDGVGVLTCDKRGTYMPDKDSNNIAKFLNRLLGLPVAVQNTLFQYFLDTLNELTNQAKRDGRYDLGILGWCTCTLSTLLPCSCIFSKLDTILSFIKTSI